MKNRDKMNFDGNTPQNRESELSECQGESLGSRFAKRNVTDLKDSGIPWIGKIPKDWEIVRTKNVFTQGKELVGENSSSTQLLSLTTRGIKEVEIGSTSGKVPDSYNTYQLVKKDNMVMCLFDLDCSAVFSGLSPYEGMISPAYKVLTVKEGFKPKFYDYWFNYIFDGRKYMFLSKNIRYSLTYDEFASLGIVKPPILEQKAIAEFLDRKCGEIDKLVALQDKMIEELKAYKQSIITETVTKGLNPNVPLKDSGIEWIGEIPQHWKVVRLGAIGSTINGISKDASSFGEGFPFVSYKDVYNHYNLPNTVNGLVKSNENEQKVFSVNYGDIFFTRTSETIEEIGFSSVCLNSIPNAVFAGFLIRFRPIPNIIEPKFSKFFFRAICHRNYFVKEMNLVTRASLSQNLLKSMPVLLPPLFEQQEIADFLDKKCSEIDSLIELKQQKIEELKDYKKSIIYEYVTGKKSVGT